jgi:hypothetical protein
MEYNKDAIYGELIKNQLSGINLNKKLALLDLKRLSENLNKNIFGDECSLWDGAITNLNTNKKAYISFFYNSKKIALHRLLYINFVDELNDNEYIKFLCTNAGKCCCLKHFKKVGTKNKEKKNDTNIKSFDPPKLENTNNINNTVYF